MRLLNLSRTFLALAFFLGGCQTRHSQADESSNASGAGHSRIAGEFSFAGQSALTHGTEHLTLSEILDLPESKTFRGVALDTLAFHFQKLIAPGKTNAEITGLIRPLLDDILDAPSHAEAVQFKPSENAQWFYAFNVGPERSSLWETNARQAAKLAGGTQRIEGPGVSGVKFSLTNANALSFAKIGSWVVVTTGKHSLGKEVQLIADLAGGKTPAPGANEILALHLKRGTSWLESDFLKEKKVSALDLSIHPQRGAVRSELKITLDKGHPWILDPWRIPTNTIQEPLIALTAIRSVSNWFAGQKAVQKLQPISIPNQLFFWGQNQMLFPIFAAVHVPGNSNVLQRFSRALLPEWSTNLNKRFGGEFLWVSNLCGAFWQGLPAIVPFVRPGAEADHDVIYSGLIPFAPLAKSSPPPPELIAQIVGRTNLLYYDWEVTTPRINQFDQIAQMFSTLQLRLQRDAKRPAAKWLEAITPKLENTITEATLVNPQEVSVVRRSVTGLSSIELVALSRWLEHPAFPNLDPDFWLEPKNPQRAARKP